MLQDVHSDRGPGDLFQLQLGTHDFTLLCYNLRLQIGAIPGDNLLVKLGPG